MTSSAEFWDRIAERYARKPVADEETYQRKLAITRDYLQPEMELFEFGCGTGSTAIAHAPYVRRIEAIDISPKMIEIARRKSAEANIDNVNFSVASIEQFEPADEGYDVVLGLSILHLVADKEEIIGRVYRMLKPGGVFVTSTACIGDAQRYLRFMVPLGRLLGLMPLVKVFTTDKLVKAMTDGGFAIDQQWSPGENKAVFIVARKTEQE
ncbi:MAG: SAM-dependent methyltransferase [Desulfuromonas sp.]|nr:MAG: SAM-dependent methyltransferase [Desulfuromonas sp.]